MNLPLHTRALALVTALSTTAAIIVTVAEIGHPSPDGYGVIASVFVREAVRTPAVALVTVETAKVQPRSLEMPQP
jgi:hypothetical protein